MNINDLINNPQASLTSKNEIAKLYFDDILSKLENRQYYNLFEYQKVFLIEVFEIENSEMFIDVIRKINCLIVLDYKNISNDLLEYEWCILDYILHNLIDIVNQNFVKELKTLKEFLSNLEIKSDEIYLLLQKLEHYGIN